MSATTEEIIRVYESLPAKKQSEVADFARFLLAQQGDAAWEQIINDPKRRPRLEAFMEDAIREGRNPVHSSKFF